MASSMSPNQTPPASLIGGPSDQDKSPLSSLNLNFLKTLTEKRTTKDGQPQKRRGPKPDSKPALTRRQELNRQAQRTHRERKELYIKALEDEVLRLKEVFSNICQDKERLVEENRQLRALLSQNGMATGVVTGASSVVDETTSNPSIGYTSSASMSGGYVPASSNTSLFTPPPLSANAMSQRGGGISPSSATSAHSHHHNQPRQPGRNPNLDYDQAGIDFVLTLEKPCMNHMPWLIERGVETGHEPCGHALMASCPPEPFSDLSADVPFGYSNIRASNNKPSTLDVATGVAQRTWELNKTDLATLLDLSKRLDLDGEITPVMAWGMVLAHPRLSELREEDFVRLTEELSSKVRCYGFGAVMEEFEVRDALESIFAAKAELGVGY
ncbi:BZIP-type transcription factor [Canariomyces notabilis]|uniref:BZIP-type transcription factor n=1 Tax=Canariomyces notabilis TaxID=2074819 RepID=A0AAN6YXA7_9PEZI|nr:BZIP-type transcription factor [Canariomyces arenarius]